MDAKKKLNRESDDEISRLFKMMLMMVEDMKQDHDFHYEKLYENIPNRVSRALSIQLITSLPEKVNWIRKRILDVGNESIRNLGSTLDNYTVSFVFK